jgi:hypothetical protein
MFIETLPHDEKSGGRPLNWAKANQSLCGLPGMGFDDPKFIWINSRLNWSKSIRFGSIERKNKKKKW